MIGYAFTLIAETGEYYVIFTSCLRHVMIRLEDVKLRTILAQMQERLILTFF